MDMGFGTLNIRSLYRAGPLMKVSKEQLKYKLHIYILAVQEVRWEAVAHKLQGITHFSYGKGNENHELGTGICA
jgi:hypothetical protein